MYAIYGKIYHQYPPNVRIYISYMDPMGYETIYANSEYMFFCVHETIYSMNSIAK
jgi:hypothetical protein